MGPSPTVTMGGPGCDKRQWMAACRTLESMSESAYSDEEPRARVGSYAACGKNAR